MDNKCGWGKCKYWSYDMDSDYCTHPVSIEISNGFGASTNRISREGLCMGNYDDETKNTRALWEPIEKNN